jgi:hypothetical protein
VASGTGERRDATPHPHQRRAIAFEIATCFLEQAPVGKSQNERVSVGSLTLKGGGQVGVGATRNGPRIECDCEPCTKERLGSVVGSIAYASCLRPFREPRDAAPTPTCPPPFRVRDPTESRSSISPFLLVSMTASLTCDCPARRGRGARPSFAAASYAIRVYARPLSSNTCRQPSGAVRPIFSPLRTSTMPSSLATIGSSALPQST